MKEIETIAEFVYIGESISVTPVVSIKSQDREVSFFRERLRLMLKTAEYSSDEFIDNFTYQLANSLRSVKL